MKTEIELLSFLKNNNYNINKNISLNIEGTYINSNKDPIYQSNLILYFDSNWKIEISKEKEIIFNKNIENLDWNFNLTYFTFLYEHFFYSSNLSKLMSIYIILIFLENKNIKIPEIESDSLILIYFISNSLKNFIELKLLQILSIEKDKLISNIEIGNLYFFNDNNKIHNYCYLPIFNSNFNEEEFKNGLFKSNLPQEFINNDFNDELIQGIVNLEERINNKKIITKKNYTPSNILIEEMENSNKLIKNKIKIIKEKKKKLLFDFNNQIWNDLNELFPKNIINSNENFNKNEIINLIKSLK